MFGIYGIYKIRVSPVYVCIRMRVRACVCACVRARLVDRSIPVLDSPPPLEDLRRDLAIFTDPPLPVMRARHRRVSKKEHIAANTNENTYKRKGKKRKRKRKKRRKK